MKKGDGQTADPEYRIVNAYRIDGRAKAKDVLQVLNCNIFPL